MAALVAAVWLAVGWGLVQPRAGLGVGPPVEVLSGKRPPFGAATFVHFYLGCRAALAGGDAYRPEDTLGPSEYSFTPLFHPPPSLLPYLAISGLEFDAATWVNICLNVVLLSVSGWLWGAVLSGERNGWVSRVLCACSWVLWLPCLNLLGTGQCTAWALLGISGWLAGRAHGRPAMAGAWLVPVVVKPHVVAATVLFALGFGVGMRRSRMVWVFVLGVLVWCAITECFVSGGWSDYLSLLLAGRPSSLHAATMSALSNRAFGTGWGSVSYVAWACGCAWCATIGWRLGVRARAMPHAGASHAMAHGLALACAIGLVAVPHAYSYDFILLLPGYWIAIAALASRRAAPEVAHVLAWIVLGAVWMASKVHAVDGEVGLWWVPCAGLWITGQASAWRLDRRRGENREGETR